MFSCAQGDILLTPPLASGLLPGTLRARLLAEGRAREEYLSLEDFEGTGVFHGQFGARARESEAALRGGGDPPPFTSCASPAAWRLGAQRRERRAAGGVGLVLREGRGAS